METIGTYRGSKAILIMIEGTFLYQGNLESLGGIV